MKLSDFNPLNNTVSLTAGEALTRKDAVVVAADGKAYKAQCTATAGVSTLGTAIYTDTIVNTRQSAYLDSGSGNPQCVGLDGTIYIATAYSGNNGLTVYAYNPDGTLKASVSASTGAAPAYFPKLVALSNGNILLTANMSAAKGFVYDSSLGLVADISASMETPEGTGSGIGSVALSGGGFALSYVKTSTHQLRMSVWSNAGAVVTAAFTVATSAASVMTCFCRVKELSNGNLLFISNCQASTYAGAQFAIFTTAGVQVKAIASVSSGAYDYAYEAATMAGFFCISVSNGTSTDTAVFDNSGTQQGSTNTVPNTNGGAGNGPLVFSDGVKFFTLYHNSTTSTKQVRVFTTAGAVLGPYTWGSDATTFINPQGFYERGYICVVATYNPADQKPKFYVFNTVSLGCVVDGQVFGTVTSGASHAPGCPSCVALGDFSFNTVLQQGTTVCIRMESAKYLGTAVVGAVAASVSAGASVPIFANAGAYATNTIKGSMKAFDHSTTAPSGNKGAIMTNGLSLKGF